MKKNELLVIFDGLGMAREDCGPHVFSGTAIPGSENNHIGKDCHGRPAILIDRAKCSDVRLPPIKMENLSVEHAVKCQINQTGKTRFESSFMLIRCLGTDRSLHEYFLQVMPIVLDLMGNDPNNQRIYESIYALAELFRAITLTPPKSAQGLWAELFMVKSAGDPHYMITCWHADSTGCYDFSDKEQHIEVKCSAARRRNHFFSFEQANPPSEVRVLVASLFVENMEGGLSLGELWDQVKTLAGHDPEARMKVEKICIETLGAGWREARSKSYDHKLARTSLMFYRPELIPRIAGDIPLGVTEIKFRSDLALAQPVNPGTVQELHGLFRGYLGRK